MAGTPAAVAADAGHAALAALLPRLGVQAVATRNEVPRLVAFAIAMLRRELLAWNAIARRNVWAFLRGNA